MCGFGSLMMAFAQARLVIVLAGASKKVRERNRRGVAVPCA